MKKLFYIVIFVFAVKVAMAQSFKAEIGDLSENNDIGIPVLYMKNGTTFFEYDGLKDHKMYITIFDKQHHILANKKEIDLGFKEHYTVYHWFDDNGKPMVWIDGDHEQQYRLTFNAETGNVEKKEELKDIPMLNSSKGYLWAYTLPDENLVDPLTGNTVKLCDTWKSLNKNEVTKTNFNDVATFTVKIYGLSNQEIQSTDFDLMNHDYQGLRVFDCIFYDNTVYILWAMHKIYDRESYDHPTTGDVFFSKYDLKTKKFMHKQLFNLNDYDVSNAKLYANSNKTYFNARFLAKAGTKMQITGQEKVSYQIFSQSINATTLNAERFFPLSQDKLDEFVKTSCNQKSYGSGFIDRCRVDNKGKFYYTKVKNVEDVFYLSSNHVFTKNAELIGITAVDKTGNELQAWAYPYLNTGVADIGRESTIKNDFSYIYASGTDHNILFLNNTPANFNKPLDKTPGYVKNMEECNAIAVELTDNGLQQYYVFGTPADNKNTKYVDFRHAIYDEAAKMIIAKVYEGPGYKNTSAAWIQLN